MLTNRPLTQRINNLSERQAKIVLIDLSTLDETVVRTAVYFAEDHEKE